MIAIQFKSQIDFYLLNIGASLSLRFWNQNAKYLYDRELLIEFKAICVRRERSASFYYFLARSQINK